MICFSASPPVRIHSSCLFTHLLGSKDVGRREMPGVRRARARGTTVFRTLRKIRIVTATAGTAATAAYIAAASMAAGDSASLSPRASNIALHLITACTILSGVAWLVELGQRENANAAAAAAAEVADKARARMIAEVRQVIHSELIGEELDEAVRRAHRWGMVSEAGGRTNVASIRRT